LLQNKNSLSEETIEKSPNLGAALKDSMSAPLISVGQRFQGMEMKVKSWTSSYNRRAGCSI